MLMKMSGFVISELSLTVQIRVNMQRHVSLLYTLHYLDKHTLIHKHPCVIIPSVNNTVMRV